MISAQNLTKITNAKKFSMKSALELHLKTITSDARISSIKSWFGNENHLEDLVKGLIRWSFLIESVGKEKGGATKIRTRWSLPSSDPRYATYQTCADIYNSLLDGLNRTEKNKKTLISFFEYSLLPYEIPVDYSNRNQNIHRANNCTWSFDNSTQKLIELRSFLLDSTKNGYSKVFSAILKDKIKTKVYLTDRVQTGEYKTNREKRWEVHPSSVHFASRSSCFDIERILIEQLCDFKNFPLDLRAKLSQSSLVSSNYKIARCPITLDELDFNIFKESVLNPQHGISDFQVGHLNPLKANPTDPKFGHTAKNIAWVTSNGNRIQGHLTLDEWSRLLERIISNKTEMENENKS